MWLNHGRPDPPVKGGSRQRHPGPSISARLVGRSAWVGSSHTAVITLRQLHREEGVTRCVLPWQILSQISNAELIRLDLLGDQAARQNLHVFLSGQ